MVMAIAVTLVAGTLALGTATDAQAISKNPYLNIKAIGSATCTTASGGECDAGLLKSKVRLLVQEVG
jgi:hypothetical protein